MAKEFRLIAGQGGSDDDNDLQPADLELVTEHGEDFYRPYSETCARCAGSKGDWNPCYQSHDEYEPLPTEDRMKYLAVPPGKDPGEHFRFLREWQDRGWVRYYEPF